jgi:hypothetical protein
MRLPCNLRFDGFSVCGIMVSVSFRPFNLNFWHATIAGLVCLAFVGVARAGDGARMIEVVPFHNTSMDTNYAQPGQDDLQNYKTWQPTAPNSVRPSRPNQPSALPQSQHSISKEEQQLQERRRNWVFMTPEDYATTDPETGKSMLGANDDKDDNMTAMERFYHRLEQSTKPSTKNDFSQMNPDRSSAATNFFDSPGKTASSGMFGQTPFDSAPQAGVFQSISAGDSAGVFGNNNNMPMQSPEDARIQAAQKAHMENFKQLWDINQASSAATPVSAPSSAPVDSSPLFGASTPGLPTPFKPILPTASFSPGASKPTTPIVQPVIPPRYTPPPHSDFAPTQRPF